MKTTKVLLSTERVVHSRLAISIALLNVLVALITYSNLHATWAFSVGASVSAAFFAILLWLQRENLLFLARTLIIGLVGYYPAFVKIAFGHDAYFSAYEQSTQTMAIVYTMYLATSLALLGSEAGFHLARSGTLIAREMRPQSNSSFWKLIFYVSVPIAIYVAQVTIGTAGENIFVVTYGLGTDTPQLLGNTQNIGIICLLAAFVATYKADIRHGRTVVLIVGVYFLFWAMFMRGLRQDVVTALMGLAVCYGLVNGRSVKVSPQNLVIILAIVTVVEIMGIIRSVAYIDDISLVDVVSKGLSLQEQGNMYHFGTVSPIATTFANTIFIVDSGGSDLHLGKSYFEYILRSPPEFLYPARPRDYAWIMLDYNLLSGGGFFELAEAYINFGLWGCLVMPAILSFLLGKAYWNVLKRQSAISYFLLFSFLGMFLRGTWYQVFAFYKSFLTAMILYFFFAAIYRVLIENYMYRKCES